MAKKPPRDPQYTMHTEMHALAKDVSEYCAEPKKFAMYLGTIKRVGLGRAYQLFSILKDPRTNAKHPGRWFMFMAQNIDPRSKK
jgi:hypothetical protein